MQRVRKRERRRIDYSVFANVPGGLPKGVPLATERKRKQRATLKHRKSVKLLVKARERGVCIAFGISPICTQAGQDRHEIIPIGAGGKVCTENCVWTCRADHDAAQSPVGGRKLIYDWTGKADGLKPNADEPGNVRPVWVG